VNVTAMLPTNAPSFTTTSLATRRLSTIAQPKPRPVRPRLPPRLLPRCPRMPQSIASGAPSADGTPAVRVVALVLKPKLAQLLCRRRTEAKHAWAQHRHLDLATPCPARWTALSPIGWAVGLRVTSLAPEAHRRVTALSAPLLPTVASPAALWNKTAPATSTRALSTACGAPSGDGAPATVAAVAAHRFDGGPSSRTLLHTVDSLARAPTKRARAATSTPAAGRSTCTPGGGVMPGGKSGAISTKKTTRK
jgi:hypothetical protein